MPKWTIFEKILHHKVEIHTLTTKTLIIHLIVNQSSVQLILHSSNKGVFIIVFWHRMWNFMPMQANSLWVHTPFGMTWWLQWGGPRARKKNYWCTDFFFFFWIWPIKHFFFNDLTRYNDYNSNIVHIAPSDITIFLQLNVLVRFLLRVPTGFQGCLPVYINSWTVICLRCWGT